MADFFGQNFPLQVGREFDRLAIDLGDHIAGHQLAHLRRGTRLHTSHDHTPRSSLKSPLPLLQILEAGYGNTQPRTAHVSLRDELARYFFCGIDGNSKANAAIDPADERVDADHATFNIAERSAAIAGIDGGIGLEIFIVVAAEAEGASLCAHNAKGERVGKLHRRADGEGEFSHLHRIAIP